MSFLLILVMLFWDKTPMKKVKFSPASFFVVLLGVLLNSLFKVSFPFIAISSEHLVNIPSFKGIHSIVTLPNFTSINNPQVWGVAFTIAVIASIETLLNLEAVENIDPYKRQASPNSELLAQEMGNVISGLIDGIPITSVIVRSSVNLNAGAQTKISAILHGLFLLICILLLSPILNFIPLASLATILLLTGYKLAKISLFKEMYKNELNQFIPFVATIIAIVFTDLIIGVLLGLAISIFYILKSNFKNVYHFHKEDHHAGDVITIRLTEEVSFLNKANIKRTLADLPENSTVIFNAAYSTYIDFNVLELIKDFTNVQSIEKKIIVKGVGTKMKYNEENNSHVKSFH